MARPGKGRYTAYWLLAPGAIWLLLFFVIPFYSLVSTSLYDPDGSVLTGYDVTYHVANYWHVLKSYHPELLRSLWYAGLATLICLVIGYVLAYAIAFKAGKWRNLLLVLVIAPFFTSFLLRTLSWKLILSDHGFVVSTMKNLHLDFLLHNGALLNSWFAVVAGIVYNFLPFMVLPLYASLEKIDGRLVEAASDLYANPFKAFFKVTWPLSLPGVVAGTLLTFIPAAGDYINAQLLGGPGQTMVGNKIENLFTTSQDYPDAGALSMILMILIIGMVMVYVRTSGTEDLV
jgi:spermidine/putrescine transport system permease protein